MKIHSLNYWLQYLESLPSGLVRSSLENLKNFAANLHLLDFNNTVITVAGTNGKGSTIIFLESILLSSGFKICSYISPHLLHYNERIRLNGVSVDDATICWALNLIKLACDKSNTILSYFEFTTLAALAIFKISQPDFLLLEVGLGGRFDAVNIVDSNIAVITTISFDHTSILGNTKNDIGKEKAGIIRSLRPVVCGKNIPDTVYSVVLDKQAQLYCLNKDFTYYEEEKFWHWSFGKEILRNLPLPRLPIENAALALMVIKILSADFKILKSAIVSGLSHAFLLGRFQKIMTHKKEIIFDVAHNFEAATLLANNLSKLRLAGRILAVVGMLQDKDISAILCPVKEIIDKWFVGIIANVRTAKESQLISAFQEARITNFILLPTIADSLQQAIAECREKDRIVMFGSCYTVAEGLLLMSGVILNGFRK
jgi:dihydrofolate synthase/folylpolyglutamate synthase